MKFCYFLLKPFLGKKGLIKFWEKVYLAALFGIGCGDGSFNDSKDKTGEIKCFKYIKDEFPQDNYIIFDVGANYGQYATGLLNNYDENSIFVHSFEPCKKTFETLKENVKKYKNIKINNFGISSNKEKATLYSSSDSKNSGLSSIYKRDLKRFDLELDRKESIELNTIDDYCKDNSIKEIDLLKIDIEGNEYNALLGAKKMLDGKKIKAIQIEFGGTDIDSRTFVKDFWDLLSENYRMYRIVTNGLYEITEYKETMEIFFCTNYLFIRK